MIDSNLPRRNAQAKCSVVTRISPRNQARIFERFERAVKPGEHGGGFGIGLWIVRQLSEAMGGTITVASELGAGSTFSVTLPLQPAKDAA